VLGGETGDGFALVEDGGTALVELGPSPEETGRRVVAALAAGVEVVVLCAAEAGGDAGPSDSAGARTVAAIEDGGGLRGAALVVLYDTRAAASAAAGAPRRDPRGGPTIGLAGALRERYGAALVPGPAFVLAQLGFVERMRAARAVVVGEARLERATLGGRVAGEAAIRARQAGVPCHAIVGTNAIDGFDARILDVQAILEAGTVAELEAAGERLAAFL